MTTIDSVANIANLVAAAALSGGKPQRNSRSIFHNRRVSLLIFRTLPRSTGHPIPPLQHERVDAELPVHGQCGAVPPKPGGGQGQRWRRTAPRS